MIDNNMRVKTIGKIENINRKAGVVADIDSIRGGRLIVADKKQLSLIPVEKCKVGMVIYVQSENKEYTLIQEPTGTIYTDSANWEVKKTNAEDVYVQNGSKQTSVVEDYTTKINAITTQTLETIAANYTPKTEFEQQMNAATARITTVEERSTNNASRLDAVETNISANAAKLQKLNDDVFGTERNNGLKQDIDNKIEQANDSIAAMSDNIKTNQNDIRSLTQKVTTNGESISAINSEITNNIKADISDIKKNIGDYNVSQQFKTVADQISNANANANTQHSNLQTSINRVNNRLAAYKESTDQTINEYGDKLKDVEKTASDNKDALKDTIGNLSELSEQVTRNYGDFETLNTTVNDPVNGLSIQCTKLNNQFTKLYGDYNLNNSVSLSSIVENISKNATNISANTTDINGLKTKITDLNDTDTAIKSKLTALKNKFGNYTLKSDYDTLNSTVTGLSNTLTNTKADLTNLQDSVANNKNDANAKIDKINSDLKNKLDSATYTQFTDTFNSTLSTVANNANAASATATNALDKANDAIKQVSSLNAGLSADITGLTNNLSTLTNKVDANTNNITSINNIIGDRDLFINTANHTICDYITDMVRKDTQMQASIEANTNKIDGIKDAYQAADGNLGARIDALNTTVVNDKAELDAKDTKFTEDIQTIKNDIININNTTAANSEAIKTNTGKIDTLTSSVSEVQRVSSKNKGSIEALQDVVNTNTESINSLKTDKSAFLEDSGLSKDSATAQTLYNATLYTLKGFINTHEISDIEKRDAKETTIIGNIVANAKAIDAVKASIKTNSDNIDKNTQSIAYLNETAKSLKLQPVIEDISSDKSTGEVKVKLDIENIKMTAFQYMTLGIAGRTKEDKTTSSTWVPNSSSEYFGISDSLLTDEEGNTNMVTVRGYITPQNAAVEDQIYLESDPMDLTKEFSITYGFIKPETKTINGNTYHQYVELGKTKIHFFDDDGVTIKIKLPDRIADDDANVDDSVKLAIGFTNVDNREADVADSCFAFSLAGAFEATSLDGATEDGGLYIIRSNKEGDSGEIVNHGSFAITSNAIRRAGEVGFVTVFQI